MADIFDEMNEEMRAERTRALVRRWALPGGLLVLLVLAGVGGWQGWQWWQARQSAASAGPFLAAMQTADKLAVGDTAGQTKAADAFAAVAKTASASYRTLARLREAALRWDAGDKPAAFSLWDAASHEGAVSATLRDLGALLWAQHSVDSGDPTAIAARTSVLEQAGNPWRPLAEEVDALVAVRLGDKAKATKLLTGIATDPAASQGLRGRVGGLLTLLGAPEPRG